MLFRSVTERCGKPSDVDQALMTNFDGDCDEISAGWALTIIQPKIHSAPTSVCQLSNAYVRKIVVLVHMPNA